MVFEILKAQYLKGLIDFLGAIVVAAICAGIVFFVDWKAKRDNKKEEKEEKE